MPRRRGRSSWRGSPTAKRVALVSDAGTPLVSDPGYKLVRAAREAGHAVTAVPGASAVLAALAVARAADRPVLFRGFPAGRRRHARRARIAELAPIPATLVLFETGPRLAAALADLADGLGPRGGRDLPRAHQTLRGGAPRRLATLARDYAARRRDARRDRHRHRAAEPRERGNAAELDALLRQALDRVSVKDAVGEVAPPPASRAARSIGARSRSQDRDDDR